MPDTHLSTTLGEDGVLRVAGEVEEDVEEAFSAALEEASSGWTRSLVVDMGAVTFFPSRAISRLLAAHHAAERGGVALTVVAPPGSIVVRVLRACGLLRRFHVRDTVEDPSPDPAPGPGPATA